MSDIELINEQRLASYLETHLYGFKGPLVATKFAGGQSNPTFKIESASGVYVLRRQPPGQLLKSAHAVDREYRVLAALRDTDVPVAAVYHLCEDVDVVGSIFYLMEYCDGNVHWSAALESLNSNAQRTQCYKEMNRILAAIHSVDVRAVGLTDFGKSGNYFQRQFDRWSAQYRASELSYIAEMEELMSWLSQSVPEDDGRVSLVHGDFRLDNLMFAPNNRSVIAVLDWELSTLGHPFADLAYQCMGMRLPAQSARGASSGLSGVNVESLGIPSEEQYLAEYCQRMGLDTMTNWNFYLAFSFFRMAAICQGVAKRAADGNASSTAATQLGMLVRPIAAGGLHAI